jgi:hypothetical protein
VALEIEKGLGRSRVRNGLEAAGFVIGSTWSHIAGERDRHDGYLTEVDGFVVPESPALAALDKVLDGAVQHVAVIGSFAVPPRVGAGPASGTLLTGPDV